MTGQQHEHVRVPITEGTATTGLWCETCLLTSRYVIPLYVLGADGPICVGVVDRCDGHQS